MFSLDNYIILRIFSYDKLGGSERKRKTKAAASSNGNSNNRELNDSDPDSDIDLNENKEEEDESSEDDEEDEKEEQEEKAGGLEEVELKEDNADETSGVYDLDYVDHKPLTTKPSFIEQMIMNSISFNQGLRHFVKELQFDENSNMSLMAKV